MLLRVALTVVLFSGTAGLAEAQVFVSQTLGSQALGSQAAANQGGGATHTVTGTVLNSVTNEPIQRALVRIDGPVHSVAFTGADGRFSAAQVPEGSIFITAQRPGFGNAMAGGWQGQAQAQFTVTSGSNDFNVMLTPDCRLAGVVVDSDGEPVEGVNVQVMVQMIWRGHKSWQMRLSGVSDETGSYEMEGLQAGAVLVATTLKPLTSPMSGGVKGPVEAYPAVYYPGGPDRSVAQPITLQPGQTAHANFTLRLVATHQVTGVVSGIPPNTPVFAQVEAENGQQNFAPVMINQQTGRFTIANVPDGEQKYLFMSQSGSPEAQGLRGELRVAVSGADVNGAVVHMQRGASIEVQVNRPAGSADAETFSEVLSGASMQGQQMSAMVQLFRFHSEDMQSYSANPKNRPGGQGENFPSQMSIEGVASGEYQVVVQPFGGGCVDSVMSGGTDLTRQPLNVSEGSAPQPIVVNLRNDCGSISTTLRSADRLAMATMLVTSDSLTYESNPMPVQIGQQGGFELGALSPGTYRVYGFDDASDLEFADPEVMRNYRGTEVTIVPHQRATINVDVVRRVGK